MKKKERNIIKISLILLMILLTSCKNRIYTACPDIVEYSTEFRHSLAEDLKKEDLLTMMEQMQKQETESLINKFYGGSKRALFSALLDKEDLTDEQVEELQRLIDKW